MIRPDIEGIQACYELAKWSSDPKVAFAPLQAIPVLCGYVLHLETHLRKERAVLDIYEVDGLPNGGER